MRYRLRTLLILIAVGPALGPGWSFVIIVILIVAVTVATWISFWPDRKFHRAVAAREPLDETQFYANYYSQTNVPFDTVRRLRPMYCKIFDIEVGKLRPHDRPPILAELDTSDFIEDIEMEFGVSISDKDAETIDGSFDSIVRFLAAQSRLSV